MRTVPLLVAASALVASCVAGWLLLAHDGGPGSPSPGPGPDTPSSAGPGAGAEGGAAPPLPASTGSGGAAGRGGRNGRTAPPVPGPPRVRPTRDSRPEERLRDPDAVPAREPRPLPEGAEPGEFHRGDLPEHEEMRVEETRERLHGMQVAGIHYRGRSLKAVAGELAELSGVPVELSGEDLEDEPLEGFFPDTDAFDRLLQIAVARNLRFEVHPDRIVIRR